jgi:hypothetical protein
MEERLCLTADWDFTNDAEIVLNFRGQGPQGQPATYLGMGVSFGPSISFTTPARIKQSLAGTPNVSYNAAGSWDNVLVAFNVGYRVADFVTGVIFETGHAITNLNRFLDMTSVLGNQGPTETTYSVGLPFFSQDLAYLPGLYQSTIVGLTFSASVSATVRWNVTIGTGMDVNLNQSATIETLTIEAGGVAGNGSGIRVRGAVENRGEWYSARGTVDGPLTNNGILSTGGTLTLNGGGTSSSDLRVSAGTLVTNAPFINTGLTLLNGGTINAVTPFINRSGLEWEAGTFRGNVRNEGPYFRVSGTATKTLNDTFFVNAGTVLAESTVYLTDTNSQFPTVRNESGGNWHIRHDGTAFALTSGSPVIENFGLMTKDQGTGTATLTGNGLRFEAATGTVQVAQGGLTTGSGTIILSDASEWLVESGNLTINGTATASGANFTVSNGRSVLITSSPTITGTLTATGSGKVVVTGSIVVPTGQTLTLNLPASVPFELGMAGDDGFLTATGVVTNTGVFRWITGTVSGAGGLVNQSQTLTLVGTASKTVSGNSIFRNEGRVTAESAISLSGGTPSLRVANAAGAVWDAVGDFTMFSYATGSTPFPQVTNLGTILKSAGTGSGLLAGNAVTLDTSGATVRIASGSLSLGNLGTVNFNGATTWLVESGNLTINGTATASGANFTVSNGRSVLITSSPTITGTLTATGSGKVVVTGSIVVPTGQTLTLNLPASVPFELGMAGDDGFLTATGVVTNTGVFRWITGTVSGAGGLVNQSQTLTLVGTASKTVSGNSIFRNEGRVTAESAISLSGGTPSLRVANAAGAVWDAVGDFTMFSYATGSTPFPQVTNLGTILKSGGTGTASLLSTTSIALNNTNGRIEVLSGQIGLANFTNVGTLRAAGTGRFSVNGSFTNTTTGVLDFVASTTTPTRLVISGAASLGGTLRIEIPLGLTAGAFRFVQSNTLMGSFAQIDLYGAWHKRFWSVLSYQSASGNSGVNLDLSWRPLALSLN